MSDYTFFSGITGRCQHKAKYFALIFCFFFSFQYLIPQNAFSQWTWQNPLPFGNTLTSVAFFDNNNAIIGGDADLIGLSGNAGSTWTSHYQSTDGSIMWNSVQTLGPNLAVGTTTSLTGMPSLSLGVFRTTNGGLNWTNIYSTADGLMNKVYFVDANTGTAIGRSLTGPLIIKTTNGGQNWVTQVTVLLQGLLNVEFIDANTGVIVSDEGGIIKTTNGGDNWIQQVSGTTEELHDIAFIDANTIFVTGVNGVLLKTTNGGDNWNMIPGGGTSTLASIDFINANTGNIIGPGIALRTTDGGNNWTVNPQVTTGDFVHVNFNNANTGIAVGAFGSMIKSTDGGENWQYLNSGEIPEVRSCFYTTRNIGYAIGFGGFILKTTNSGQNWVIQTSPTGNVLNGLFFTGINTGTAVSTFGGIIKTTNGGTNWFTQTSNVTVTLQDVSFVDANTGLVVGNTGTIVKTTNGGDNWIQQTSGATQNLTDVVFINANTAVVSGASGRVLRTTNRGDNWSVQTVSGVTQNLNGIFFADANTGWAVGASGRIIKTTNAGVNWAIQTSGTTSALNGVFFTDVNNGIIAGSANTILRTTNGGTNWTPYPHPTGSIMLFNEVFSFDVNNSTIVGQFGTILRTQTPAANSNYGNNSQSSNNLYYFANSTPAAAGAPSQPQFIWRDTTGSIDLYANGVNQASGIFTGDDDNGRWNLLSQLGGGNVRFFGSNYTDVYVGTNGILGFNAFNVSANQPPFSGLSQSLITEAIFPLWMDMNLGYAGVSGRRVSYKVTPTELIVTYDRIPVYSKILTNDPDRYVSFQVIVKLSAAPTQNSEIFISYNYDETGSVFKNEYNEGTLASHLVGIQKNNTANEFFQYRFKNSLVLSTEGPIFGSNLTIATGPDANVLPVELASFNSLVVKNEVILDWSTVSEINNASFEVERTPASSNDYNRIGSVEGNGTSNSMSYYKFSDNNLQAGKYKYRLKQIDFNGNYEYIDLTNEVIVGVPAKYDLSQNYPNPFNPVTKINFEIPVDSRVTLKIFDISGREVATLVNELRTAGYYTVSFDAHNFASGIYFYRVTAGDNAQFTMTKKMMLVK